MKVSIVSESPADEAAVHILLQGLLQQPVELLPAARARAGGWPSALNVLDVEFKHLHYNTDADALAIVVDSDDSPLHEPAHEQPGGSSRQCRLCLVRETIERVRRNLKPRWNGSPVRVAVGVAVPAIEAWYRCGADPHATEDHFARELAANQKLSAVRNGLKRAVYGTDRPSLQLETDTAVREAQRLVGMLQVLEERFERGFAPLARDVRAW